jgi:phosphohistidine phosphatase
MKIFILRHGEAEAYQTSDSSRQLTDKGKADSLLVLKNALPHLAGVECIYASPLIRAQQTAQIASELLGIDIHTTNQLEPEADISQLFSWLGKLNFQSVLLVSHLPLVALFANQLCGLHQNRIQFGTSSLVGIECELVEKALGNLFLELHA